jgi:hypothetical protein
MKRCATCGHVAQRPASAGIFAGLRRRLGSEPQPAQCGACESKPGTEVWDMVFCQCRDPFHQL